VVHMAFDKRVLNWQVALMPGGQRSAMMRVEKSCHPGGILRVCGGAESVRMHAITTRCRPVSLHAGADKVIQEQQDKLAFNHAFQAPAAPLEIKDTWPRLELSQSSAALGIHPHAPPTTTLLCRRRLDDVRVTCSIATKLLVSHSALNRCPCLRASPAGCMATQASTAERWCMQP
jgi:hypothetical protein